MKVKLLVLFLSLSFSITSYASADGEIKYRKGVMNAVKGSADAMVQILTGKVADKEGALKELAEALSKSSKSSLTIGAFKVNTHGQGSEKTTATAKVWEEWDEFSEAFRRMDLAAEKILTMANDGSLTMGDMKKVLFKECGHCHRKAGYRVKK